jgi:Na+/H+ antiporter NhaD/arsenite permease-like protein
MELDERRAIRNPRLLKQSLAVLALILAGFLLHSVLHLEPAVVALLGAGLLVLISGASSEEFLEDVEWETLVFFMGLFVMVGGLVNVGVIEWLGERAVEAVDGRFLLASTGLLFGSAVLSGVVDNIPYVATMSPLVAGLVASGAGTKATSLWWALALGADLGGNATAVGASANVVITGIAARQGYPISFWRFTRYGLVVTAVTVLLCWPYLWLRYFVFT